MIRKNWTWMGIVILASSTWGCGGSGGGGGGGKAGTIQITASGESLALGGYAFPPPTADDPAFVDGWEFKITRLITTIDKIKLSRNPDKSAGDQSMTDEVVAEVDGPFAVDLHKGGPIQGKGGPDEQSVLLATLENQNKNGGAAFDPAVRYAMGFDLVAASAGATKVNLDAEGQADYDEMVSKGYAVLYVGTATFKGGTSCTSIPIGYDFTQLPTTVNFKLGFKSPTTYANCQNPDNDPASALGSEEHQRGVQVSKSGAIVAQVTVHTDHPLWDSFTHDSPIHFDQIAAHYIGATGVPTATVEDFVGVGFNPIKDKNRVALPWRKCVASFTPPNGGPMSFDPLSVPVDPSSPDGTKIRDYADYMTYNQSTQGHINSDGLCFVKRNYPSPP